MSPHRKESVIVTFIVNVTFFLSFCLIRKGLMQIQKQNLNRLELLRPENCSRRITGLIMVSAAHFS